LAPFKIGTIGTVFFALTRPGVIMAKFDFDKWKARLIFLLENEHAAENYTEEANEKTFLSALVSKEMFADNYSNITRFLNDFPKFMSKYQAVIDEAHDDILRLHNSVVSIKEQYESFDYLKDTLGRKGKKPLPQRISRHLLEVLEQFKGNQGSLEALRIFLSGEVHEHLEFDLAKLRFSLPVIPLEKQKDTYWANDMKKAIKRNMTSFGIQNP
jgi:hypothetical protein